jgi:ribosomal protein S18 acetylase RimI-like enzyme
MFRSILTEVGLKKISERVEYQCYISLLPGDAGSPFEWKTAKELGWDTKKIAQFTGDITKDAVDVDPDEKPEDFVQDWLHHKELTSGLDCIALGFIDSEPCALVVAQVNKETGSSRLSYMGIIPEFRGNGFGKWVHRHGFKMMRDQGGKLYHGGTHGENLAMQKLFESHGCKLFCEMEEWAQSLSPYRTSKQKL